MPENETHLVIAISTEAFSDDFEPSGGMLVHVEYGDEDDDDDD